MLVLSDPTHPDAPAAVIPLSGGLFALVDPILYDELIKYSWYVKKSFYRYYAVRSEIHNGKKVLIRMHRQIANTPGEWICHHINKLTLDNRRANLQNMSHFDHVKMHSYR